MRKHCHFSSTTFKVEQIFTFPVRISLSGEKDIFTKYASASWQDKICRTTTEESKTIFSVVAPSF
jgi:hypothetical protein